MDNGTSQIVDYEGVLWMGLHFGLAWASYAQWIIIFLMDFIRVGLRKLQLTDYGASQIAVDAKSLSKIPNHLALITEDDASLHDLANIVLWTVMLGVSCVTIHCKQGMNPVVFNDFVKMCEQRKAKMKSMLKINFHNEQRLKSDCTTACNVLVSSVSWSRHKLTEAVRVLGRQVQSGELRSSDIDLSVINRTVQDDFPEPDLAVNFGSYPSLQGLNPWDTRLTEIITVGKVKNISYTKFLGILGQFAGTKQRFGK